MYKNPLITTNTRIYSPQLANSLILVLDFLGCFAAISASLKRVKMKTNMFDFILTTVLFFLRPMSKSLSRPHYMSRFLLSDSIKFRKVSSLRLVNKLCFAIIFIFKTQQTIILQKLQ